MLDTLTHYFLSVIYIMLRLVMHAGIEVSIWESRITLGNYRYEGTIEEFGAKAQGSNKPEI